MANFGKVRQTLRNSGRAFEARRKRLERGGSSGRTSAFDRKEGLHHNVQPASPPDNQLENPRNRRSQAVANRTLRRNRKKGGGTERSGGGENTKRGVPSGGHHHAGIQSSWQRARTRKATTFSRNRFPSGECDFRKGRRLRKGSPQGMRGMRRGAPYGSGLRDMEGCEGMRRGASPKGRRSRGISLPGGCAPRRGSGYKLAISVGSSAWTPWRLEKEER